MQTHREVWDAASLHFRAQSTPPGKSSLLLRAQAAARPSPDLCAQQPGKFHPQLPWEQSKARAENMCLFFLYYFNCKLPRAGASTTYIQ